MQIYETKKSSIKNRMSIAMSGILSNENEKDYRLLITTQKEILPIEPILINPLTNIKFIFGCEKKDIELINEVKKFIAIRKHTLYESNLSNADISNINLSKSNLYNSNLTNINFSNSNLNQSDIRNAILKNSNFSNANLQYVDLTGADLSYANLTNADLTGANLTEVNLTGVDLENAITKDTNLNNIKKN